MFNKTLYVFLSMVIAFMLLSANSIYSEDTKKTEYDEEIESMVEELYYDTQKPTADVDGESFHSILSSLTFIFSEEESHYNAKITIPTSRTFGFNIIGRTGEVSDDVGNFLDNDFNLVNSGKFGIGFYFSTNKAENKITTAIKKEKKRIEDIRKKNKSMNINVEENLDKEKIRKTLEDTNYWTLSVNFMTGKKSINYYDISNLNDKIESSKWDFDGLLEGAYHHNLCSAVQSVIGLKVGYSIIYNEPTKQKLITEFTPGGVSTVPQSWYNKEIYLNPLMKVDKFSITISWKLIYDKIFGINPILQYFKSTDEYDKEAWKYSGALAFYGMLDKDKEWSVGIKPEVFWEKNDYDDELDGENPDFFLGVFITKAFKL